MLEEGAGVVTSRGDVHYVVTEYGVADLWGKSIRERALALIEIAHPDHRAELLACGKARRYVFPDQLAPTPGTLMPSEPSRCREGIQLIRPLRMTDERVLQDLFYRLSDDSTYQRFLCHKAAIRARKSRCSPTRGMRVTRRWSPPATPTARS